MRQLITFGWLLLVSLGAIPALATTITDTLTLANGALFNGTLQIRGVSIATSGAVTILPQTITERVSGGSLNFTLESNVSGTPAGTSYFVTYLPGGRTAGSWSEYWVVPDSCSPSPCEVHQIRVTTPPVPNLQILLTQLAQGGATDGQQLTWDDTNNQWQPEAAGGGAGVGIDCSSPAELTISAGSITISSSACYRVDTESETSSDDLTSITCASDLRFILRPESDARTVTIKHDGTAIRILADFEMNSIDDTFEGWCRTTDTVVQVNRSSNGG